MPSERHDVSVQVRFKDVDAMGHVHNGTILTYVEEGRRRYFEDVVGVPFTESNGVLAHQSVDYKRPILLGDDVDVTTSVTDVGESSITFDATVWVNGERAADATVVHVCVDPETYSSVPVPDDWRENIETVDVDEDEHVLDTDE